MALAQRDVPGAMPMSDDSLLRLAVALKATGYSFTTVTSATHSRVNSRLKNAWARTATDVFGWSRPFRESVLTPQLFAAMRNGTDRFRASVAPLLDASSLEWHYQELDPDVFGEELTEPAYADADRIAAVLLTACNATA